MANYPLQYKTLIAIQLSTLVVELWEHLTLCTVVTNGTGLFTYWCGFVHDDTPAWHQSSLMIISCNMVLKWISRWSRLTNCVCSTAQILWVQHQLQMTLETQTQSHVTHTCTILIHTVEIPIGNHIWKCQYTFRLRQGPLHPTPHSPQFTIQQLTAPHTHWIECTCTL